MRAHMAALREAAQVRRSFIEGLLSTRIPAALRDEALSLWGAETRIGVVARDFGEKRTQWGSGLFGWP